MLAGNGLGNLADVQAVEHVWMLIPA